MDKCPLTGQPCDKEKCKKITKIENGIIKEYDNCCTDCWNGMDFSEFIIQKLKDIFQDLVVIHKNPVELPPIKICVNCNYSLNDFVKTGRMGCSECYKTFREELGPVIKNYHNAYKHTGKQPSKPDLEKLKYKLAEAIKIEDYETAAKIRDELNLHKLPTQEKAKDSDL